MSTYKIIKRKYNESMNEMTLKNGLFIARGQWADGHLAYSRVNENGEAVSEDEECAYVQLKSDNGYLYMQRI